MYVKMLKDKGSLRKAAEELGLSKSKFMVLLKKEQGLCTATTACKNKPEQDCTRCAEHLKYAIKTRDSEKLKKVNKNNYWKNREERLRLNREYQKNNLKSWSGYNRKYSKTTKGKVVNRAKRAYRRAMQLQATPPWVDKKALKTIYANCPKGFHVDHIIPLDNELVCGLHVPWNLQYLSAFDNDSKGNKWDGTYENVSHYEQNTHFVNNG